MFNALIVDINGIVRGLKAPLSQMESLLVSGMSWPRSLYAMRLDGGVVEDTGIGIATGDPDYPCSFLPSTHVGMPWRQDNIQALMVMKTPSGDSFYADPRTVLESLIQTMNSDNYFPLMAVELEFYLTNINSTIDESDSHLYAIEAIDKESEFFDLLQPALDAQNISSSTVLSEYAPGQFEVNLRHQEPLQACLESILLRRVVRGCAQAVGRRATFMAKPYGEFSGNGMHIHLSLQDKKGGYYFADTAILKSAVAGALRIIPESMAVLAPFANSYRRFLPESYVPLSACWDTENRNAAVRLPLAASACEARLEMRVAGADANPYLAAATLLTGVYWGIQNKSQPPAAMDTSKPIPLTWHAALAAFSQAEILPMYWNQAFSHLYHQVKTSEWKRDMITVGCDERKRYQNI